MRKRFVSCKVLWKCGSIITRHLHEVLRPLLRVASWGEAARKKQA